MTSTRASRSWRCSARLVRESLEALEEFARIEGGEFSGKLVDPSPEGSLDGWYRYDGELFTVTIVAAPGDACLAAIWDRVDRICGSPVART